MYCYICGKRLQENTRYCPHCNTDLENYYQNMISQRYLVKLSKFLEVFGYITMGLCILLPFLIIGLYPLDSLEITILATAAIIWIGINAGLRNIYRANILNPVLGIETQSQTLVEYQKMIHREINHSSPDS